MSLQKTITVASMTIEESLRKKIFYILLFLSLALVGLSSVISTFGLGSQVTIIKDLSLSGIGFFGILFTISLLLNLVPGEIEQRTIYPLLSQPVTRADYLWGKFLGIFFLISVNLMVLGLELTLVLLPYEPFNLKVIEAVFLIIIQCGILGAMIILFSLMCSYPLTISITLFLFIVGSLNSNYVGYLLKEVPRILTKFVILIKLILPKFDTFNIKNAVVHNHDLAQGYFLMTVVYGVLYIIATMMLAQLVFDKKDL
jgi:ABC-type transport system involved in multi-copper enzyme maturation permease subunit